MTRHRFFGPIGVLALTATLVVACSDAPTAPAPHAKLSGTTVPPPPPPPTTEFKGLCPRGWGLVRIEDLPESEQERARKRDERDAVPPWAPAGNRDGFVCIKGSSDDLLIIDNTLPLDE